jgi:tetratricopeptide (TPR) repeat protein
MMPSSRIVALVLALSCAEASWAIPVDAPPPSPPSAVESAPAVPASEQESGLAALEEAKSAFKQGRWQEALDAAAEVLETQPDDLDALYIAGTSERQTNRIDEAEGNLRTLVEASPRFRLAHYQLGFVLFLEADRLQNGGRADLARAKFAESAREFAEELSRDPTHIDSLSSRAIALARAGEIEESVQAHEAWIASTPNKNAPVVSLAATYAVAGLANDAMRTLDRLPKTSGVSMSTAARSVAKVFVGRKDWLAAIPFFERAAGSDSASAEARACLTECYAQAGKAGDTARSLKVLLTMDPTPEQAQRVGEAIKSVLGDGESVPSLPGIKPPTILRIPSPNYPKGQDTNVETVVRVLTLVRQDGAIVDTVLVPNRIWKDIRSSGFEAAAINAVTRARFAAGTKDGDVATLWLVVAVKFAGSRG